MTVETAKKKITKKTSKATTKRSKKKSAVPPERELKVGTLLSDLTQLKSQHDKKGQEIIDFYKNEKASSFKNGKDSNLYHNVIYTLNHVYKNCSDFNIIHDDLLLLIQNGYQFSIDPRIMRNFIQCKRNDITCLKDPGPVLKFLTRNHHALFNEQFAFDIIQMTSKIDISKHLDLSVLLTIYNSLSSSTIHDLIATYELYPHISVHHLIDSMNYCLTRGTYEVNIYKTDKILNFLKIHEASINAIFDFNSFKNLLVKAYMKVSAVYAYKVAKKFDLITPNLKEEILSHLKEGIVDNIVHFYRENPEFEKDILLNIIREKIGETEDPAVMILEGKMPPSVSMARFISPFYYIGR